MLLLFICSLVLGVGCFYILKKKRNLQDLITSINPDYHRTRRALPSTFFFFFFKVKLGKTRFFADLWHGYPGS